MAGTGTGTGFSFSTAVPNYLPFMDHNLQFSELRNSIFNSQTIDVIADNFLSPYQTTSHNKRKATQISQTYTSSTPQATAKYSARKGKRVKANENEEEEPKEVIHVRARRGQAADSHSLDERVRRGKINERLRCLQDIVPGCYKSMGMAIMLDEIINYIQSLQNQVEFLSMKLTAASSFFYVSSEIDATETIQISEDQELERLIRDGYGGASSIWP